MSTRRTLGVVLAYIALASIGEAQDTSLRPIILMGRAAVLAPGTPVQDEQTPGGSITAVGARVRLHRFAHVTSTSPPHEKRQGKSIEPTSTEAQVVVDRRVVSARANTTVVMQTDTLHTTKYKPTYSDIIAFTTEPTSVTIPWFTRGYPKELHRDLESTNPPQMLGLLYEASIAPAFLFSDDRIPFSVTITPKIILRQLYQGSDPVIPPSYMPRIIVSYWGALPGLPSFAEAHRADPHTFPYVWFMFSHHSNGQEGSPIDLVTGKPNYYTGNFSTNYMEIGYSNTHSAPDTGLTNTQVSYDRYVRGWTDPHQRLQGNDRINMSTDQANIHSGIHGLGYIGIADAMTWLMGPLSPALHGWRRHLNLSMTITHAMPEFTSAAFFINGYDGQDYYNMRYDRRIHLIRIGASLNTLVFRFEDNRRY